MIQLEGVTKVYEGGIEALKGINIKIEKGEFVILLGPNSSGKSTLLKLLYGEERPSQGRVVVMEKDLSTLREKEIARLRQKMGMIFQDFKLLSDRTLYENVLFALDSIYGPSKGVERRALAALERVGLKHRRDDYPKGLSTSEKQKVALARALAKEPFLLLADEPFGNVDKQGEGELLQILESANIQGTTIVLATQDSGLVSPEKRVVRMEKGEVFEP